MRDKLLTHEVARLLGVTPDTVRKLPDLHPERIGHVRVFDRREVVALAKQRQARSTSANRAPSGSSAIGMR
jgi:hypothetical protein